MVGLPYDDLKAWRSIYPEQIFAQQLEKVAQGFEAAVKTLRNELKQPSESLSEEIRFAEASAIRCRDVSEDLTMVGGCAGVVGHGCSLGGA